MWMKDAGELAEAVLVSRYGERYDTKQAMED